MLSSAFFRSMGTGRYAIYLVPTGGNGDQRKLTEIRTGYFSPDLEWTPDNKWLIVPSPAQTDQPAGLFLISVDSPERKRLTSAPTNTVGDFCPLLSPNGNELIFVRRINYGIGEIYRVLLNGEMQAEREPEIIRHENKAIRDLAWTPDGRGILYSAGYFLANERFLQRIKLTDAKSNIGYPAIQESFGEGAYFITTSSKSKRLIYSRWAQDTNILRMELSGNGIGPSEPFIASKRTEYCVDYSPDGRAIAFVSTRSGTEEIWLCNADGSHPRQLTSMGGPQTANPRWSPNGEWIAFDSRKEGSADVYVIGVDGNGQRRLTSDPGHEGQPSWSRDGKWIYYAFSRPGRGGLEKIPAEGGNPVQVTRSGGSYGVESLDGMWFYYARSIKGRVSIWKMPMGGGVESQVHEGPLSYGTNWVLVKEGIYFTKLDGSLEFLEFGSLQSRAIAKLEGVGVVFGLYSLGLTISPDRRWILYTKVEKPQTDIMLVENFR